MIEVIEKVQDLLVSMPGVNYVDENWGQLDYYSPNHPVKWPCILIDINQMRFTDIGMDRGATPKNRQQGEFNIELRIANVKLTNTSGRAPASQKSQARSIWLLVKEVHKLMQGFEAGDKYGKLIRTGLSRVAREDGVQEYVVFYSGSASNV